MAQFRYRRIIAIALALALLPNLAGQSTRPTVVVHLQNGSSFNGRVVRKAAGGLIVKTKYGELTIPGKDISSVDITISIESYDNWDRYLDSLFKELTGNKTPPDDKMNNESSEIIETGIKEKQVVETPIESPTHEIAEGDESLTMNRESSEVVKPVVEEERAAETTEKGATRKIAPDGDESVKKANPVKFVPYDVPPKPLTLIKPVYPELAQEAGIEGTVYVQVFINDEGQVTQTRILKGVAHTGLNESSIDAVRNTLFQPALYRGKPVGVWITIPITYKLK